MRTTAAALSNRQAREQQRGGRIGYKSHPKELEIMMMMVMMVQSPIHLQKDLRAKMTMTAIMKIMMTTMRPLALAPIREKAKKTAPKRQPSDYLRKAQPSTKADELAISAAPYLQSTDPAPRNARRIAKHLKKIKLARNVNPGHGQERDHNSTETHTGRSTRQIASNNA